MRRVTVGIRGLVVASLVSAVLPLPAAAQPRAAAPSDARANTAASIAVKTLPNGLKIIVWPDRDIPNVALYLWFRVGSRNERPGITGLSHFFEHMMFNGSARYPSGEFDRVMERSGGSDNAFTSEDVTCYQDWFPKNMLELVFQLEADRMCCLSIDPTMVQSERQVVYSERRTSVDDDNASLLDEQVQAAAFVAHPYQIPVIGWPSDIEGWTIEDLRAYFKTHYAPNNATMILVGDVSPQEVFSLADRTFGSIPAQPPPPKVTTREPAQLGERRVILRKAAQTPLLEMAFHTGAAGDPEAEARDLLINILLSGESSRLYRRLVDRDRLAIDVGGFVSPEGFDPGLVKLFVTVSPDKSPEAAESALTDELATLARSGPSREELEKAKNARLAAYWRHLKTIDSKAEWLGTFEVFRGDYRKLFSAPDRYARVTRADVRALAKRIFDEKNRTVGILIPEKEK